MKVWEIMKDYIYVSDILAYLNTLRTLKEMNAKDKEYCDAVDVRIHAIEVMLKKLRQ